MSTTLNATGNGRLPRKSLASQIDRLDAMLDGLADAIPDVIADTIRAVAARTVRDAVQAAVAEVLSSPGVLAAPRDAAVPVAAMAQPVPPPEPAQRPGVMTRLRPLFQRVGAAVATLRRAGAARAHSAGATVQSVWRRAVARLAVFGPPLRLIAAFRQPLLAAVGVGAAAATAAWFAAPWLASVLTGVGGFSTAVAVQGGLMLRRLASPGVLPRG